MFKTKSSRIIVALLFSVLFSFSVMWIATDEVLVAAKFVLGLYCAAGAWGTVMIAVNSWIEDREGE